MFYDFRHSSVHILFMKLSYFQCSIDLKRNMLVIGTTGNETAFLPESELPEHARLNRSSDVSVEEDKQIAEAMSKSDQEGEYIYSLIS